MGESPNGLAWHLPQVFACYLLSTIISLYLLQTSHYDQICFLCGKSRQVGKGHGFLVGELQHLSPTPLAGTSLSFSGRIILHKWPQGLGDAQKPCCNIAYLLVWVENTKKDRHYGISLVWVHPNQVRVITMEEAVEKLTSCTSSGTDWPYALAQLCEDPHHSPLPKNKHLGILPQGKAQETFCGQISQLEVCQLLATSPQPIYPIGLNGHDEPIITTLPEPLDSGISLITSKHIYLGIVIPSPPVEETDQKMPPLEDIPTILITNPPNLPLNQKAV